MLDTQVGKVVGAAAAFGAAVLLYRAVYRVFVWVFNVRTFGVGQWLATAAAAIVLVIVAERLWTRWRLVLGGALLFFSVWTIFQWIPDVHRAASSVRGYYNDRFDLVNTSASWCTAIVLAVLGLVALGRETVVAALHRISGRKKEYSGGVRR